MEVVSVEITMVLCLPREVASVPVSREVLDGCLQSLGVVPDTRADIALALDEACANVVQHAGAGQEYEVAVSASNGRCVIEVFNTGRAGGGPAPPGGVAAAPGDGRGAVAVPVAADVADATAEHGRGLKIIDTVADNLRLTGDGRQGLTVHFEKRLQWLPGAPGQHLFSPGE
jgi:serine/threonine-protein kinase RsbW